MRAIGDRSRPPLEEKVRASLEGSSVILLDGRSRTSNGCPSWGEQRASLEGSFICLRCARSECARSMRAIGDRSRPPLEEKVRASLEGSSVILLDGRSRTSNGCSSWGEQRASLEGSFVCLRCARSECARSMRAIGDRSRPPLEEKVRASLEGACEGRLDDLLCSCNARSQKGEIGSRQPILLARRTRTMKRIGRTPTLVLCSRNRGGDGA